MAQASSSVAYRARFSSGLKSTPMQGFFSIQPSGAMAKLNMARSKATDRLADVGAPALVTESWRSATVL